MAPFSNPKITPGNSAVVRLAWFYLNARAWADRGGARRFFIVMAAFLSAGASLYALDPHLFCGAMGVAWLWFHATMIEDEREQIRIRKSLKSLGLRFASHQPFNRLDRLVLKKVFGCSLDSPEKYAA